MRHEISNKKVMMMTVWSADANELHNYGGLDIRSLTAFFHHCIFSMSGDLVALRVSSKLIPA